MKILGKLAKTCYVACSGGVDSMSLLHFLLKGGRQVEVLHINYGTEECKKVEEFIEKYSIDLLNAQCDTENENIENYLLLKSNFDDLINKLVFFHFHQFSKNINKI